MDYILHTSYRELCDLNWETGDELPPSGIIHVPMDHIVEFFNLIEGIGRKYIVVSSNSDYGIIENGPDVVSDMMTVYFSMISTKGQQYNPLLVMPRCDLNHCRITDKYLVSMYVWAKRSFNSVPKNVVKWFATNVNVEFPGILERLPFGVPDWTANLLEKTTKDKFSVYINMQNNNLNRVEAKKYLRNHPDVICEEQVSKEDYVKRLQTCPFVLSLPGNGGQCFRTMESLYCGAIPVLVNASFNQAYQNMPVVMVNNVLQCIDSLRELWNSFQKPFSLELPQSCFLPFWHDKILESRQLLH